MNIQSFEDMAHDTYSCFAELKKNEAQNKGTGTEKSTAEKANEKETKANDNK